MEIETITHKGLRRFVETGNAKGLVGNAARIRLMISFLIAAESDRDLEPPPNFGFHRLKGERAGTCAMTVTRNWRMTFGVTSDDKIIDLNLEDYHGH